MLNQIVSSRAYPGTVSPAGQPSQADQTACETPPATNYRTQIWATVKTDCAAQIKSLRDRLQDWKDLHSELQAKALLPGVAAELHRVSRIMHDQEASPTPTRLVANSMVLAELKAIADNPGAQFQAVRTLNQIFFDLEPLVTAAQEAAKASLEKIRTEMATKERDFFASFGLPHESTSLTRIIAEEIKGLAQPQFEHGRQQIRTSPQAPGHVCNPQLAGPLFE